MVASEQATDPTSIPAAFGLRARLQAVLPGLSRSMAKLAQFLLENPELPAELSIAELAARSGVSSPTITRFCKLIGYGGYTQMRVGAAADLGRTAGQDAIAGVPGVMANPEMGDQELLRTFLSTHIRALQTSADLVDLRDFRSAAQLIAGSEHVDVYGVGGSSSIAKGLVDRLYQIGINARAWSDLQMGIMSASCLTGSAVGIGVSSSGHTTETVEMLAVARSAGAGTIAITSDPASPLAAIADVVIRSAPADDYLDLGAMASSHTQLFAADLLYVLTSWQDRERSARFTREAEATVQRHRIATRRAGSLSRRPPTG
ncbi:MULTISPECIES: MurR/RpiR family transcriptional regulator [unclassified Microbacterium]|uniref:MurR/RpiR family transcriptional regulator n=1 Tax=unclassified Microbacterium TaxID=2609290 RepID=UPI0018DF2267|nr:MurR/RpiR family transcriptional regulator [Microbacterium sp. MAH-37]